MSIETEIQTEVDALRARFEDTKALYREVCALLFFRYGITPTANKLYQFVRKGSMSAPADALTKFWDEMRSKARIEIDHPDLPGEIKEAAASAIAAVWRQASAAAREELRGARDEAAVQVSDAQAAADDARRQLDDLRRANEALSAQIDAGKTAVTAAQLELEQERRAHTATSARLLELQRTCDDLRGQQQRLQEGFSADLAKAQAAVHAANERADASERRFLLEVDQERQARARAEKSLEATRVSAAQIEERARAEAQTALEAAVRQTARLESLEASNRALTADLQRANETCDATRVQLREAEATSARASAEAATLQAVLQRLTPPSAEPGSATANRPSRETKRKN
jgi:hypothetical protein